MQAALLVRGFPPKVGFLANFLYTHIVNLTQAIISRWAVGGGGGEPKKDRCAQRRGAVLRQKSTSLLIINCHAKVCILGVLAFLYSHIPEAY